MTAQQNITVSVGEQPVDVVISDENLNFSVPILSVGWPFGENPKRVVGLVQNTPTVVDRVAMPGKYRVVKWLLLLSDDSNDMGVSSEINAFMKGGQVEFTEFSILGDADSIQYEIDFVVNGNDVQLLVTSHYTGLLDTRVVKIGVFS